MSRERTTDHELPAIAAGRISDSEAVDIVAAGLPAGFVRRMAELLDAEEFRRFMAAYGEPPASGLRLNALKPAEGWEELLPEGRSGRVDWAQDGYYIDDESRPGKHPGYHAGLYYIQEPSAMAPAEALGARPGDRVLDLCAAPGGKSTQLAAKLQGRGVLVSNDNHPDRVKALVKNLELAGARNAVVLNEEPERLAAAFPAYFDKVLVDAPCSGEGMFRREEKMRRSWERHGPEAYVELQARILRAAAEMVKPGGELVYSTCTFSPEENEAQIVRLLAVRPDFEAAPIAMAPGFAPGRPEWVRGEIAPGLRGAASVTARLWPHRIRGEGHYLAKLRRKTDASAAFRSSSAAILAADAAPADAKRSARGEKRERRGTASSAPRQSREESASRGRPNRRAGQSDGDAGKLAAAAEALRAILLAPPDAEWRLQGDFVYAVPSGLPSLSGLNAKRPGWFLGTVRGRRFVPSQALALGIASGEARFRLRLAASDPDCLRYLKGETLQADAARVEWEAEERAVRTGDYVLVCLEAFPLGWGKWQDGMLKNEYPPGWRWI